MKTRIKVTERNDGHKTYVPQISFGNWMIIFTIITWPFRLILSLLFTMIGGIDGAMWVRLPVWFDLIPINKFNNEYTFTTHKTRPHGNIESAKHIIEGYLNSKARELEKARRYREISRSAKIKSVSYIKYP